MAIRGNTDNIVPCRDYGRMSQIWLEASAGAHGFMPREFWEANAEAMRSQYLPSSVNYAYLRDGEPIGFISLTGSYVEALFVMPSAQGQGIGKMLLDKAKSLHPELTLDVYSENVRAVEFYLRNGFSGVDEHVDSLTGHREKKMRWPAR